VETIRACTAQVKATMAAATAVVASADDKVNSVLWMVRKVETVLQIVAYESEDALRTSVEGMLSATTLTNIVTDHMILMETKVTELKALLDDPGTQKQTVQKMTDLFYLMKVPARPALKSVHVEVLSTLDIAQNLITSVGGAAPESLSNISRSAAAIAADFRAVLASSN
jgi:hypothetical protein